MTMETGLYWMRPKAQVGPWHPAWVSGWPWGASVRFMGANGKETFSEEDLARYEWVRVEAPPTHPLKPPDTPPN